MTNRPFTLTFLAEFAELRGDLLGRALGEEEVGEGDFLDWVRVGVFFKRCTVNRPFCVDLFVVMDIKNVYNN